MGVVLLPAPCRDLYGLLATEWQPFEEVLTEISSTLAESRQLAIMSLWMASIAPGAAGPRIKAP